MTRLHLLRLRLAHSRPVKRWCVLREYEAGITDALRVDVTQSQFDALVSWAYNVGLGAAKQSTLMRLLNAGDVPGAADQFLRWNRAGGVVLRGLTRRREAERDLFLEPT